MNDNKMLKAYRTLLNHAKASLISAEKKTWHLLGHSIEKAEQADHALAELTSKEFEQVQKDVHTDIMQAAEYLSEVEKGVDEFITMDLPLLETILIDKAMTLADPTDITLLRLRLAAAMDENHPVFDHPK
ncbi:MAG: zinc ribbon-containing protein [Pseudomonadota bacterium]